LRDLERGKTRADQDAEVRELAKALVASLEK